jgi:hypothetical protein
LLTYLSQPYAKEQVFYPLGLNQFDSVSALNESHPVMARVIPPVIDSAKSLVQTRVPHAMRVYLRAYGKHHGLKMEALLVEVLEHFLSLRPDLHGLQWRKPLSHRTESGMEGGWAQINVLIPDDTAGKLAGLSMQLGLSRAVISYTALYWFARYIRPPVNPQVSTPGHAASFSSNSAGATHV